MQVPCITIFCLLSRMLKLQIDEVEIVIPVGLFIFKIWEGNFSDP